MKAFQRCKKTGINVIFSVTLLAFFSTNTLGQCPTTLLQGQNLLTNGDFSQGYTGWTYTPDPDGNPNTGPDGYIIFNPPVTQNFSQPGFIYASTNPSLFNSAFGNFTDHTSTSADNMMLMVDGVCQPNIKLWSQSGIPLSPNTNYYFSVWVHALKDGNSPPGTLQFDINGSNLPTTITAPTTLAGGWVQYEATWFSGASPTSPATISIENTTVTGCDQYVDFAIDDITFIPGCTYASSTTAITPNLGPDQTICGKGGASISLNVVDDGINDVGTNQIWWSDGVGNGTGGAGPGQFTRSITPPAASLPLTMAVCTQVNGGCIKTDVITISGDYSVDIQDVALCNPASTTLDAVFTGTGVTYQWYKETNGTPGWQQADTIPGSKARTLFVNSPGTYRVVVNDPLACGVREDQAVVTSSAPVPTDQYFCPTQSVTLSVSPVNSGKYKWWKDPTSTSVANLVQKGGNTYTFSATATSDYIFYIEDTSAFRTTIGEPLTGNGFTSGGQRGVQNETQLFFDALTTITIDTVYMRLIVYGCPNPIGLDVYNTNGTLRTAVTYSYTAAAGCVAGGTWQWVKVPVGVTLPPGNGYSIRYAEPAGNNTDMEWFNAGMTYPKSYSSAVRFTGPASGQPANSIPGMFRWVVSAGTPCARVPIRAIYNCNLPVELTDFRANLSSGKVLVEWTTAWEENNSYFVLEKSSDGIAFEAVGSIDGNGTTNSSSIYHYTDYSPLNGTSYYRLVQYDIDGTAHIGPVAAVNNNSSGVFVSPNPNKGNFSISFQSETDTEVILALYNPLGQVVHHETISSSSGNFRKDLNVEHLVSGIYYLHLEGLEQNSVIKILKE